MLAWQLLEQGNSEQALGRVLAWREFVRERVINHIKYVRPTVHALIHVQQSAYWKQLPELIIQQLDAGRCSWTQKDWEEVFAAHGDDPVDAPFLTRIPWSCVSNFQLAPNVRTLTTIAVKTELRDSESAAATPSSATETTATALVSTAAAAAAAHAATLTAAAPAAASVAADPAAPAAAISAAAFAAAPAALAAAGLGQVPVLPPMPTSYEWSGGSESAAALQAAAFAEAATPAEAATSAHSSTSAAAAAASHAFQQKPSPRTQRRKLGSQAARVMGITKKARKRAVILSPEQRAALLNLSLRLFPAKKHWNPSEVGLLLGHQEFPVADAWNRNKDSNRKSFANIINKILLEHFGADQEQEHNADAVDEEGHVADMEEE